MNVQPSFAFACRPARSQFLLNALRGAQGAPRESNRRTSQIDIVYCMRIAVTVFCASLTLLGQGPAASPVYFNHSDIVVDPTVYDALAQSKFLKEEFSG